LRAVAILAASVLLVCGSLPTRAAPPEAAREKLDPRLQRALEAVGRQEWLAVGVTLRGDDLPRPGPSRAAPVAARQERVLGALPAGAFRLRHRYRVLSGVAGFARPGAVEALAAHPEVRSVYLDGRAHPTLAQGRVLVGADDAHALGVTGAGVNVAVLDTGIDTDHPDLADDLVHEECFCADSHPSPMIGNSCCPNGQDTQSGPGAAEDHSGHGTAVAGIITSAGTVAGRGVAPDAGIVAVRVSGPQGALFSDIAAGLDWVLDHRNDFADPIRAVNLSLSDGGEYNDPTGSPCSGTNTADAIEALHGVGIPTFVSSGNDGFDDGVSFPGCNARAISVGGVYDASFASVSWCGNAQCTTTLCTDTNTAPDRFVCHTNSDEILDLLAPDYQTAVPGLGGGIQGSFGGTSASSPYAAGQAALLFQADPGLDADQILAALSSSGVTVTNPANGLAFARSDVGEAVAPLVASCGNGETEPGEDCDDGGTLGGDCCAADCSFEGAGAGCDDADACTTADACDGAGSCVGGPPLACNDADVCTDDSCSPASGCVFAPNTAPCDDADACTTADACDGAGGCVGGPPLACGDADPCTAESCDSVLGCVSTAIDGCGIAQVPALSRIGSILLAGALISAGALMAAGRLR
jgi:hypothetical protein